MKKVVKNIPLVILTLLFANSCTRPVQNEPSEPVIVMDTVIVYREKPEFTGKSNEINRKEYSIEEQEIRNMIGKMHQSWQKLIETGEEQEVLQYFAPAYITNQVSIYADNSGNIQSYTNKDFPNYLKEVKKRKGYVYKFSNVDFLDVEIKDKKYFNAVYKSKLIEKDGKGKKSTNSIIITVTGKKMDGEWKIGNYSWVNFEYE